MQDKLVLITGGTSGIGFETARALAEMGAHVIITARDEEKGHNNVEALKRYTGSDKVDYLVCDFADQQQVRELAASYKEKHARLDVLINNHGAAYFGRQTTTEGYEMTLAVNHLGYFLLTHLLLDTLKASAPARIVNVASNAHERANIDFNDIHLENEYAAMKAYGQSKLGNILFTYELSRRLEGSGVTVNCLHPGFVATNMGANNIPFFGFLFKLIFNIFVPVKSPEGASTSIYLASSPEIEGTSGKYFVDERPAPSNRISYNVDVARRLWDLSMEMTGLN
ncbi:MAG: SDR family NAD(P)-dependent oxidoreductase [Chloroflexi bacterium]|nr:MAG: SDR family NAD(P)-dependent oxidoreductase [Chloroflexota bacterium]MBL1195634.1 SDR family oxidoreductase [Chloroflexota bacterium]NOH12922.1 SDR family oxidoreductase [Chloroflexota bacterium]